MDDRSFKPTHSDLIAAIEPLIQKHISTKEDFFAETLPEFGIGERQAIETLAPIVFNGAAKLDAAHAFAHMDPHSLRLGHFF